MSDLFCWQKGKNVLFAKLEVSLVKVPKLELTEREVQTLNGILLVEKDDLKDLIQNSDDKDKKELEEELERVKSIKDKLNK